MKPTGRQDPLAPLGVLVTLAGLFFTWSQSPYWCAWPSELSSRYDRTNVLPDEYEPGSGTLRVLIYNSADRPARHVDVLVYPVTTQWKVSSDTPHEEHEAPHGRFLVRLERIPARSWATVEVIDDSIPALPRNKAFFGASTRFRYAPEVVSVQTEFGGVPVQSAKLHDRIDYLTDDTPGL